MQTSITPRQAYRLCKRYDAGMDDPMTIAYGAGEHVTQMFHDTLRKQGTNFDEIGPLASFYYEQQRAKRLRFKDPARLLWKERESLRRMDLNHPHF